MNPEELSEVKSSVYPKLERVPGKQNWVDHAGGLPSYIERIAKHLHYEKGFTISAAIASAVNTVKRWATAGNVTKSGKGAKYQVTAATRAKAAKAVAQWEAKKKSGSAKMKAAKAIKEAAVEDVRELTALEETEVLEAVADPEDYTEQIVNDLVRYFDHARKLAEQMVDNSLADRDGISMTPDERGNIRGRLETRLALLEGVALSLTGDERTRSLAVANAYQILTPGGKAVKLNEVEAVEEAEVRWLFAQLDPEIEGLQYAVDALSEAKLTAAERAALPESAFVFPKERRYPIHDEGHARAALGMVAMHGTPDEIAKVRAAVAARYPKLSLKEADTTADYPNLMSGKCENCGHSISKHDKDGKCEVCAKERAYRAYEMQEAKKKCGCWDGYCRVPGTKRCAPGSCKKCDASRKKGELSEAHDGKDEGDDVRVKQLQARLGSLGFDTKVDGKFGKKTEARVKEFQLHAGLIQDGVVGPKTTERLQQAPENVDAIAADPSLVPSTVSREEAPEPLDVKDAEDAKKPEGDSSDDKDEKKSKTVAVQEGLADGFGSEMETGPTIMPDDLNLMNPVTPIQVAPMKGESTFSPPRPRKLPKRKKPPRSVLFKGLGVGEARSNPEVREVQADLGRLGYNIEVDGRFGPQTEQAVKRFQRKYGLKADGVVGMKTTRTMKGVKKHLEKIDEALLDQELATDAPDWQEARDRLVGLKRELAEAEKRGESAWPELEDVKADFDRFMELVAEVPEGGLVEAGGYTYKRVGPNEWALEDGQETLETDETLAYRLAHDASLAATQIEVEDESGEDDDAEDREDASEDAPEGEEDSNEEDSADESDDEDGDEESDELMDNIGEGAKAVKDLKPGQMLMLSNGEEYVYDRQADPSKPFHIIKPAGWTPDNDLKAKPMHGEIVPPKIGPEPKAADALDAYVSAGGADPMVIDALKVAEAADWDFDEAWSLVEAFSEDKHKRAPKGEPNGGQFIKAGSAGEAVERVQDEIGEKKTGKWDDKLTAAVKAYQKKNDLLVDGIVGAQTWASFSGKKAAPGALPDWVLKSLKKNSVNKKLEDKKKK